MSFLVLEIIHSASSTAQLCFAQVIMCTDVNYEKTQGKTHPITPLSRSSYPKWNVDFILLKNKKETESAQDRVKV